MSLLRDAFNIPEMLILQFAVPKLSQRKCARRLLRRHFKLRGLLEGESVGSLGQGGYNPACTDPAEAGALTSTAWELALLARHFHPHVAQCATAVAAIPPGGGSGDLSGVVNTAMTPAQIAEAYAFHDTGLFRPAPAAAPARSGGKGAARAAALRQAGGPSASCATALFAYSHGDGRQTKTAHANESDALPGIMDQPCADEIRCELQDTFRCDTCRVTCVFTIFKC